MDVMEPVAPTTPPTQPPEPVDRRGLFIFGAIAVVCLVVVASLFAVALNDDKSATVASSGISGTPGAWASGPDAPGPTDGFVLSAGSTVLAGPKGAHGLNPWTVYVYDIANRTWKTYPGPAGVPARTPYARVWDGTEMLVFGGFTARTPNHKELFDFSQEVWAFNPSGGTWRELSTAANRMPTAQKRAVQAVWTGQVVVLFGGGAPGQGPATYEYDPVNNAWAGPYQAMPGGVRIAPSVVSTGDEILAWGGVSDPKAALDDPRAPRWHGASANSRADGWAYSPSTHKWTPMKTAPFSAVEPATAWTGTDWAVYGGTQVEAGVATPVLGGYFYDPGTDTWTALPAAPFKGLAGPVAAWTGDTLVVWGRDLATAGGAPLGAVYDPVAGSWSTMNNASEVAGAGSDGSWTGSSLLVVGGGPPAEVKDGRSEHVAEWKPTN